MAVAEKIDILTIPQAARYCSVDRVTMWRWVKSGHLQVSLTLGGHHRILKKDLESLLRSKGMYPLVRKFFPKKKILIVDDDSMVRKALAKTLSDRRYEIREAADGFEAGMQVMLFEPDLLILDLVMPAMDGIEVCKRIKQNSATAHMKTVVLTGYDTEENRRQILKAGADAFLVKPVDKDTLLRHVTNLLNKKKRATHTTL